MVSLLIQEQPDALDHVFGKRCRFPMLWTPFGISLLALLLGEMNIRQHYMGFWPLEM